MAEHTPDGYPYPSTEDEVRDADYWRQYALELGVKHAELVGRVTAATVRAEAAEKAASEALRQILALAKQSADTAAVAVTAGKRSAHVQQLADTTQRRVETLEGIKPAPAVRPEQLEAVDQRVDKTLQAIKAQAERLRDLENAEAPDHAPAIADLTRQLRTLANTPTPAPAPVTDPDVTKRLEVLERANNIRHIKPRN